MSIRTDNAVQQSKLKTKNITRLQGDYKVLDTRWHQNVQKWRDFNYIKIGIVSSKKISINNEQCSRIEETFTIVRDSPYISITHFNKNQPKF